MIRFSVSSGLKPRIGRLNNRAHSLLVETFETALALKVLKMTANRAFAGELVELLLVDQPLFIKPQRPAASTCYA